MNKMNKELVKTLQKSIFDDVRAPDVIVMKPPDFSWWYGKYVPVLKDTCSYCGLAIDMPYLQHDECIRMQIEVEKNAIG